MVVESWDAADEPATPPPAPVHLLALAAKSDEALQAKLRDLAAALRDRPWDDAALHAMSWTLFTARQHFDYRCAVVAGDRESAIHALESAAGRERLPNVFKGRVARGFAPQQATTRYGEELLQRAQDANVAQRQEALQALADLYCQGYDLPWESLFANPPRRVALPTYPFAREHHWISSSKPSAPANDRRALLEKVFQGAVTAEQARALLGNQGEVSNQ
jgi:acyl transferase domain-containing protein